MVSKLIEDEKNVIVVLILLGHLSLDLRKIYFQLGVVFYSELNATRKGGFSRPADAQPLADTGGVQDCD